MHVDDVVETDTDPDDIGDESDDDHPSVHDDDELESDDDRPNA